MVHEVLFQSCIFLRQTISVPVLEGVKLLWLWWSRRRLWIFQRYPSSNGAHTCKNIVLHPALCFSLFFLFGVFILPCFSPFDLPFLHSSRCDCSVNARLKKKEKKTMSFLFRCIILPFDFDTLKRMSYNVESAKSVLFSRVWNLS